MGSVTRDFLKELLWEDIQSACDAARADGRASGFADGRASGFADGHASGCADGFADAELENIRSLMKNLKLTMRDAMNALGIPADRQGDYAARLEARPLA